MMTAGGILATRYSLAAQAPPTPKKTVPRILGLYGFDRGIYYFNPAGLYVEVGQTVQWIVARNFSVLAFHPSVDNHELRIPEGAKPFDSRATPLNQGMFEWTFDVEGTYDYYCAAAEYFGMVGRIVAGKPGGPGERPPGYGNRDGHTPMYRDAVRLFEYLKSDEIFRKKLIPYPLELLQRKFPSVGRGAG